MTDTGESAIADDALLTTDEVAALIRVPAGTLRRWRSVEWDGAPPSFQMGPKRVVYRRSKVLAWIAAQENRAVGGP